MYIRTSSVSHKHPHLRTPMRAALGAHNSQSTADSRTWARNPARANTATQLPLVSEISPLVIKAKSSERTSIFLKNKICLQKWRFFQYSTTSSLKKNPQPWIILIALSLLIPAKVIDNYFLKANTKHTQDQMVCWSLNTAIWPYIYIIYI